MEFVLVSSVLLLFLCSIEYTTGQVRACPRLQNPWNGRIVNRPCRRLGEQCVFECNDPYILVGSRVRVCQQDGSWSGQTAVCDIPNGCNNNCGDQNCPSLGYPEGGFTEGQCTPGIVGQTCTFRCTRGYSLHGQARLTCLSNGRWSAQAPHCSRTSAPLCEMLTINNGQASCNAQGDLTVCRVTCNSGYTLIGPSVVTCTSSGAWTDQLPSCQRSQVSGVCPTLFPPNGGRLVGSCTSANTGDTCQLVCLSGYRPSDTRILMCQNNGVWSNTLPRCIGSECPSFVITNGIASGTCNPGSAGQTCVVTCQPGYILNGRSTIVCGEDGRWSDIIPTCTGGTCPALPVPANGAHSGFCTAASVGQTCTFTCQAGFTLTGTASLLCRSDRTWSSAAPTCVRSAITCPNLFAPENGYIMGTCAPGHVGETCTFGCENNNQLVGDRILTCLSTGRWSHSPPICGESEESDCSVLYPPPNGEFVECDNRIGGRCVVVCLRGYVRSGSRVRTCLAQGTWSGFAPTCTRRVGYTYGYKVVPLWSLVFG